MALVAAVPVGLALLDPRCSRIGLLVRLLVDPILVTAGPVFFFFLCSDARCCRIGLQSSLVVALVAAVSPRMLVDPIQSTLVR